MNRIGFVISNKENEHRRAITIEDIKTIKNKDHLYFQEGYGIPFGIEDNEYINYGCHVASKKEILELEIICDPKVGDADYLDNLHHGQIIFGWVHATQNKSVTDKIINNGISAYAWENMHQKGRHCFWRNNEIAGEAAIMNAFLCYGEMPYNCKVAVLGRGNTARGAIRILSLLGAEFHVYDRKMESLFKDEISNYDVIVNSILWDTTRTDHIIYKDDLKRLKKNCMIIDISCDQAGAVETCIPTTISNPTYMIDGIIHYSVDHTPSIFYKTATQSISNEVIKYLDDLIERKFNNVLNSALIIEKGKIIDDEIIKFQKR